MTARFIACIRFSRDYLPTSSPSQGLFFVVFRAPPIFSNFWGATGFSFVAGPCCAAGIEAWTTTSLISGNLWVHFIQMVSCKDTDSSCVTSFPVFMWSSASCSDLKVTTHELSGHEKISDWVGTVALITIHTGFFLAWPKWLHHAETGNIWGRTSRSLLVKRFPLPKYCTFFMFVYLFLQLNLKPYRRL